MGKLIMPKMIKESLEDQNQISEAQQRFIDGKPEKKKGLQLREGRKQISITMLETLIDAIDEKAKSAGMTRAAFINAAVTQALREGLKV